MKVLGVTDGAAVGGKMRPGTGMGTGAALEGEGARVGASVDGAGLGAVVSSKEGAGAGPGAVPSDVVIFRVLWTVLTPGMARILCTISSACAASNPSRLLLLLPASLLSLLFLLNAPPFV